MSAKLVGLCVLGVGIAHADPSFVQPPPLPRARPIVPLDDTRAYGPSAFDYVDLAITSKFLHEWGRGNDRLQLTTQLAASVPDIGQAQVHELWERYHLPDYQLRVRDELFATNDRWIGGPLTVALGRTFPVKSLAISPLLFAHFGYEVAISTPWLSGRTRAVDRSVQVLDAVDSELSGNGWSVRPANMYFRGDFLACRSAGVDLGIEPELFVPTTPGGTQYGTRFHLATGIALGCSTIHPRAPKIGLEYRGRILGYASDVAPAYEDQLGVVIQIDVDAAVVQLFYAFDPGRRDDDYTSFGIRLQVGKAK